MFAVRQSKTWKSVQMDTIPRNSFRNTSAYVGVFFLCKFLKIFTKFVAGAIFKIVYKNVQKTKRIFLWVFQR